MDCVVACKTENQVPQGFDRDWIAYDTKRQYPTMVAEIRSERCNHCDSPPCIYCCPCGASHVHERRGVVLVYHEKCVGCKACIAACPYDARFVHPGGYVDKCTFCIHRVEKGVDPACVAVCRTPDFINLTEARKISLGRGATREDYRDRCCKRSSDLWSRCGPQDFCWPQLCLELFLDLFDHGTPCTGRYCR
jgi:Fe-S-cluster-containing dehydrogenase component